MKKLAFFATLLTLVLSGCAENTLDNIAPEVNNEITLPDLTAGFADDDVTKTYVEESKYLRWHEADLITAFYGNTLNRQYKFKGKTGDNSGTFSLVPSGELGTGNTLEAIYAIYPYDEDATITDKGEISLSLPATQYYADNSFGRDANTMIAVTESVEDTFLGFKNACGYLKLKLYNESGARLKSVEVRGNNSEKIAGSATATIEFGGVPTVTMSADATTSVTLDCDEGIELGTTAETATELWVVLPEVTFEGGITITATDTEGITFEKSTTKPVAITRNDIQPMKALEAVFEAVIPDTWKIYYTATQKLEKASWSNTIFGANIVSNEWDETTGEGVIIFDGEVTKIGNSAFYNYATVEELTLPKSITSFGKRPFEGCTGKLYVNCNIPSSSYNDDKEYYPTFYNAKFTEIVVSEDVTYLGTYAFSYCDYLTAVYIKATTPPTLGTNTFSHNAAGRKIYVPIDSYELYSVATEWSKLILTPYDYEKGEEWIPAQPNISYEWFTNASGDTYEISSPEELAALSKLSNGDESAFAAVGVDAAVTFEGKTINLLSDIDLSDHCGLFVGSWTPIKKFKGLLNGNSHTISNLYIKSTGDTGLFDSLYNATIKDLTVQGEITCTSARYVGGLASYASSTLFENCISNVNINASNTSRSGVCVGGVCGNTYNSTLIACQSMGWIKDEAGNNEWYNYVGGLVGYSSYNTIFVACCKLSGGVYEYATASYSGVGGILGFTESTCHNAIQSCYTSTSVMGRQPGHITNTGRYRFDSAKIANCYYSGSGYAGIGTDRYGSNYAYDLGTARSTDLAAEVVLMNDGIDQWNAANPDYICNYKYELNGEGVLTLVKQN